MQSFVTAAPAAAAGDDTGVGGVGLQGSREDKKRRRRLCVCTRIHQNNANRPVDLAKVRDFLDSALLYADSIAIAVGSPQPTASTTADAPNPEWQLQRHDFSLLESISRAAWEAEQEALARRVGRDEGDGRPSGDDHGGVGGTEALKDAAPPASRVVNVFEVTPWGKFTPALNALLSYAARDGAHLAMFQSLETIVGEDTVSSMEAHMGEDELVVGAALTGHAFQGGETVGLTGVTTPWNTLALWDVTKLAKLGFLGVAEGLLPGVPAGVEEVSTIATLQMMLGAEHARAKLVKLPQVQWQTEWEDESRRQWHEAKMSSKLERAGKQMLALGVKEGIVHHVG